ATIDGSLAGGDPLVIAKWATEKNSIKTPLLDFTNCSFSGLYTNEVIKDSPRLDPNSKIEVYNFSGNWRGLTMSAPVIVIRNLVTPTVEADLRSVFPLSKLNELLLINGLSFPSGNGSLRLQYKGPVDNITTQTASLNGLVQVQNGSILMKSSNSLLQNCNASLRLLNSDILIDTLKCTIQQKPIYFTGAAKNVLALLGPSGGAVSLTLNVSAPVLNIDHLSSIISRKFPSKKPKQGGSTSLAKTAQQIDDLLSSGNIAVNFSADKLIFHKFEARKANANILINENSWLLKKASLQHGAGTMNITAKVSEQSNEHFGLDASIQMRNMDAQKAWYEFENFGIKALNYKNIKGTLSADATVFLTLDRTGSFDMSTLSGTADFSIRNGELINFAPVQEIQKVVFKSRDFSNISFAEIKDKVAFTKGTITIDRMEVNSSVFSFFVEGVYALTGNKTDISIQVPLSNLKKRDKDYKPENLGASRGGGMSIFLRARPGNDGVIKIAYDPLKRFRKN
ncbi:MAG: AsmA-like C-terminal region-containing protein, partial [Sediminibacterium sp.]